MRPANFRLPPANGGVFFARKKCEVLRIDFGPNGRILSDYDKPTSGHSISIADDPCPRRSEAGSYSIIEAKSTRSGQEYQAKNAKNMAQKVLLSNVLFGSLE